MQRDMDLVRNILLAVEAVPTGDRNGLAQRHLAHLSEDKDEIAYHVQLLHEAGLVDAKIARLATSSPAFVIWRLTWEGHDFLASVQNEGVWAKTKAQFAKQGLGFTIELAKAVATGYTKQLLGLPEG